MLNHIFLGNIDLEILLLPYTTVWWRHPSLNLKGPVLSSVRFDQDTRRRLLPEARVSQPRSEWELLRTLQSPATHPLQEQVGLADGAGRPRAPASPEKIHRLNFSQVALCHQEIHWLPDGHCSQQWAPGEESTAQPQPRGPGGASWEEESTRRLQTRREAEATLLWKTQEMYVRAISRIILTRTLRQVLVNWNFL